MDYWELLWELLSHDATTHTIVTVGGGGLLWLGQRVVRAWRRRRLRKPVDDAFVKVRNSVEPQTLNPASPGNPDAIYAYARDSVTPLCHPLRRAGFEPPPAHPDKEALRLWLPFLAGVRERLGRV